MAINSLHSTGRPVTLGELKHTQQTQRKRSRAGLVITLIFLLLLAGIWLFVALMPVSAPVQYVRNLTEVKTPAAADLLWCAPRGPVKSNQKIATLLVRPGTDLKFEEQLRQIEEKQSGLMRERNDAETRIAAWELDLDTLQSALSNTEIELRNTTLLLEKRKADLAAEQERAAKAERLWNLDAIKSTELAAIRRSLGAAQYDVKSTSLAQEAKKNQLKQLTNRLTILNQKLDQERIRLTAARASADRALEQLKRTFGNVRYMPTGLVIDLYAPTDGEIEDVVAPIGSRLESDATAVAINRPGSGILAAYVDPRERQSALPNAPVLVKFGKKLFHTRVRSVNSMLEPLPKPLRYDSHHPENLHLKVILDSTPLPAGIMAGELGTAIFY